MKKSFSGEEFAKALAEGSLKESIVLKGMVKSSENPQVILFALGTSCQQWVSIPVEMIDKVEWLRKVPCRDHTHDYVQLFLKDEVGPVAEALASLLRSSASVLTQQLPSLPAEPMETQRPRAMDISRHPLHPSSLGYQRQGSIGAFAPTSPLTSGEISPQIVCPPYCAYTGATYCSPNGSYYWQEACMDRYCNVSYWWVYMGEC